MDEPSRPPCEDCFADLHVHIGAADGGPVKITASRRLTFARIAAEAAHRKGIGLVGVVDACCSGVLKEIRRLVADGQMVPLPGGGLAYQEAVTVIPGAELEAVEAGGALHTLSFFPDLAAAEAFGRIMARHVTNPRLSSQNTGLSLAAHLRLTEQCGGFLVPAHAFTPFKGVYSVIPRIAALLDPHAWAAIPAVELGLSADASLAGRVPELAAKTFLANSDAHSLPRIGREYNRLRLAAPSFAELRLALAGREGRGVTANYGLDPRLGKFYRSYCRRCAARADGPPPVTRCPACGGGDRLVLGVRDRLEQLAAEPGPREPSAAGPPAVPRGAGSGGRPPYHHQVPLSFVPGVGPRTIEALLEAFEHEMHVLHAATQAELAEVVGDRLAARIVRARQGRLQVEAGGGGHYGRVR